MPLTRDPLFPPPPSRAVSLAVSAGLIVVWTFVRLVVFDTMMFPLTYVLPLLVCVWTRDRAALWGMAVLFGAVHLTKVLWLLPPDAFGPAEIRANLVATAANIAVGTVAVELILRLRLRLESALQRVGAQAEELREQREELAIQNEELTQQAEELSKQTEELTEQGEELATQNEELQSQTEEIGGLNSALERREQLLSTLLETARLKRGGRQAVQHVARAAFDLFGETCAATAVYETGDNGLQARAVVTGQGTRNDLADVSGAADGFASLVLEENRPAALNDTSLRPDLLPPPFAVPVPVRAALGAPVRCAGDPIGVLVVYSAQPHDWSDEQFLVLDWLADQCGRVLETLRLQETLRAADERKSQFIATLSHELRNPLAPIRFALGLLEQGRDEGRALQIIARQFQLLVRLVDDLLDGTRLSNNKVQLRRARVDLGEVVRQATDAIRPEIDAAGHGLSLELPPAPLLATVDPERIGQVVTNLLHNAARYTPPGGRVEVRLGASGEAAILTVADTGVGLAPDDATRIFDMFAQVDEPGRGGLGIGLAIVRGIVELHGGRVDVRSDGPGHGSEFQVTLPLDAARDAAGPVESERVERPGEERPRRVLVVDDNVDASEMMAALLRTEGHTVWVAHDAEHALHVATEIVPHVALLDIGLPGQDGYQLARRLRQVEGIGHLRLIAVTGWGQDADRARARDAGFDAHLTKPADPRVLLSMVSNASGETASSG